MFSRMLKVRQVTLQRFPRMKIPQRLWHGFISDTIACHPGPIISRNMDTLLASTLGMLPLTFFTHGTILDVQIPDPESAGIPFNALICGGAVMSDLTRESLFAYLSEVMNEVSVRDFSIDPLTLAEREREAYYLRKGMSVLAKEIISRFDLQPPPA